ncbi:MAG: DNA repair protein RadA [Pseudonocardiales bacterium]|nr:DNA repair protein RadA [Pseudonocardiales bacterium]
MGKPAVNDRVIHRCGDCGHEVAKWVGRCPECHTWGSVSARRPPPVTALAPGAPSAPARPICQVDLHSAQATATGVTELDRVLGGGLVPGAVVLLAGEPGVGKSTLLLEVAHRCALAGRRALYVSGEESTGQVRLRAQRTGALHEELFLAAESDLAAVLGHLDAVEPDLLIVDSVQTMACAGVEGSPGGVSQVRAVASALISTAKQRGLPVVLVGHVTKDGTVAGPRVLEHLVDVVLQFEGDRHSTLRMVRGIKNRFGAADEVGCFELTDDGIIGLPDPSGLFLTHRDGAVPGTAVTVVVEGKRPLLGEVQALVAESALANPRRAVSGLDSSRVAMILAVIERRGGVRLAGSDVYTATVGGMRVVEPAADLAVALAVASAASDLLLPPNTVALGEVGLAGELRPVTGLRRRLVEAARLGFRHALVPADSALHHAPEGGAPPPGMRVHPVADVGAALHWLR